MARQSRDRSASSGRANQAADGGGGENRRRTRGRERSRSTQSDRGDAPSQPPRKLCAAYKAGNCKEGSKCQQSHDVSAWLKWRDYSMAAKGGGDRSSRSTSSNKRKNRKG
eukprot:4988211-Alexandrium_andersonii.AAC.1